MSTQSFIIKKLKIKHMLKNFKPIIIIAGDPKSIFLEIYFKSLKKNKFKNPLILIINENILLMYLLLFKPANNIISLFFLKHVHCLNFPGLKLVFFI